MIYVDSLKPCLPNRRWPWRYSAHLFADSLDELHRFAATIGLQRSWFQAHKRLDHYDLTYGKRKLAVAKGAIEVSDKHMVEMFKKPAGAMGDKQTEQPRNKPCPKCGSRMQVSYGEPDNKEIIPPHWWCRHCGHEEDKP